MSMTMLAKNIKAMKKMILDNRRITIIVVADNVGISFDSCQAIFTDALGMKFWAKATADWHGFGDVDNVQRRSRFAQKGHNCGTTG